MQTDLRYRNPGGGVNIVHPDASGPSYVTPERIQALAGEAEKIIPTDAVRR